MKKFCKVFLGLLAILLLTFAFPSQGWAGDSYYYAQLTAHVSADCSDPARGLVYAGTGPTSPAENDYKEEVPSQTQSSKNDKTKSFDFYAFAKTTNDDYKFLGWSEFPSGATQYDNNDAGQSYKKYPVVASGTSTDDPHNKNVYAYFARKIYAKAAAGIDSNGTGTGTVYVAWEETTSPAFAISSETTDYDEFGSTATQESIKKDVYFYAKGDVNAAGKDMVFKGWYDENGNEMPNKMSMPYKVEAQSFSGESASEVGLTLYARFNDPDKVAQPKIELAGLDGVTELTLKIDEEQNVVFVSYDAATLSTLNAPTINIVNRVDPGSDPIVIWDATNRKLTANRAGTAMVTFSHPTTDDFNAADFTFTIHVEKYDPTFSWKTSTLFIQEYGLTDLVETSPNGEWTLSSNNEGVFKSLSSEGTTRTTPSKGSVTLTFSQSASYKYNAILAQSQEFNVYANEDLATYLVNGQTYTDLQVAADEANKLSKNKNIIVATDGMVAPGDYTIPSGVALLVPYQSSNTSVKTTPSVPTNNQHDPITPYRKLTLLNGVNIVCYGTIYVGGGVASTDAGTRPTGCPTGPVGVIDMSKGGYIDLKSGATLYVWGFIVGQNYLEGNNTQNVGSITAENGSTVWENFALSDWRGGTATNVIIGATGTRCFPFQNYYVQNIEVPIRFEYGSTEKVHTKLFFASLKQTAEVNIALIGSSNSMFTLGAGGAVTKWYDPTTDLEVFELEGNAKIDVLKVKASALGFSMDIKSTDFDLPISSSFHIKLKDNMEVTSPILIQPGAVLEIGPSAELKLSSPMYVYDAEDWGKFVNGYYFYPLPTSLTQHRSRGAGSEKTLADCKLIVHGRVTIATGGGLYTTTHAADIMSPDGGVIDWKVATPANKNIYGFVSANKADDAVAVPVTAAKLHNENDSYTASKSTTIFTNVYGRWFGGDAKNEKANHTYDFTYINADANVTTEAIYWLDAAGEGHWNNATTTDVTYLNTWKGTEEETGITAYYAYTVYDQDNNPHDGWIKLTQVGTSENFGGSDNNMYVYVNDKWQSIGSTDSECLYTIGGVRQALVGGTLVPITKNTTPADGAWHATATPTNYYVDLSSGACIWTPATKVAGVEKAYVIEGTTYLRYDMTGMGEDWMAVEYQAPFYYTVDAQNLRTYYEYNANTGAWQVAAPKLTVTDEKGASQSFFFLADAIATANSTYNPTITLLADVNNAISHTISSTVQSTKTLIDLNGHTINSSVSKTLNINSSTITVTITDNSEEKNGQILVQQDANARCYAVYVTAGKLAINGGTIKVTNAYTYNSTSAKATQASAIYVAEKAVCYMNGGTIESFATYNPYGLHIAGSTTSGNQGKAYINGGEIKVTSTQASEPVGVYSLGTAEMSDGTITVTSKTSNPRGAQAVGSTSKYAGTFRMTGGIINVYSTTTGATGVYSTVANKDGISYPGEVFIEGGNITATAGTNTAYGVYVTYTGTGAANTTASTPYYYYSLIGRARATISGGTIIAQTAAVNGSTPTKTCYGVYSTGETTITGGTIKALPTTTTAYGVCCGDGTMTISGNPSVTAKATTTAYGAVALNYYPSTFKLGYMGLGVLNISGGTFNAETTTGATAYGLYVKSSSAKITSTSSDYYPNETPYVGFGTANISGGTFTAIAKTNTAYGAGTDAAVTGIIAANSTASAIAPSSLAAPTLNITGGEFYATSNGTATKATDGVAIGINFNTSAKGSLSNATISARTTSDYYRYPHGLKVGAGVDLTVDNCTISATSERYTAAYGVRVYANTSGKIGKLTMSNTKVTATAGTSSAYAVYVDHSSVVSTSAVGRSAVYYAEAILNEGNEVLATTGTGIDGVTPTTTAYGIYSAGNTTINGGSYKGMPTTKIAAGLYVVEGHVTMNGGTLEGIGTSEAYGAYVYGYFNSDYGYFSNSELEINDGTLSSTTTTGATSYALLVSGTKKVGQAAPAKVTGATTMDYAYAGSAVVNGGVFKAHAKTKTVNAVYVGATQTANAEVAYPTCVINAGKFSATQTDSKTVVANINADSKEPNKFVLNGGYYTENSNLDTYKVADKGVHTLPFDHAEYANGYHYSIEKGYKVTFLDDDNTTVLKTIDPAFVGDMPSCDNPTKAATAEYTYTFEGWTPEIAAVTGAATYTATYTQTKNKYTIIFQNEDGTELQNTDVEYGTTPSYTGATPTKAADAQYTYTFNDWTPAIVAVSADATYTATYTATKNKYTLTWDLDGGEVKTAGTAAGSIEWGTSLTAPVVEKTGYTFVGWTPEVPAAMPAEDATYTATWEAQQEVTYMVEHYYESALGVKEDTPFRIDEGHGLIGEQVSADDVLKLEGYDSPDPSTETITEGLVVEYYYKSRNLNVTDTVVIAGADLDQIVVKNNGTLSASTPSTTKRLVLTATPGNNDGANADLTNITIKDSVCIEIEMNNSGTMDDKLFYCFSVPFNVNVNGGVERLNKNDSTWSKAALNTNYLVYTYNEYDRATNGRSDNNWTLFSGDQFVPGVFYLCEFDNSNYNRYRFYAADKNNLNNKGNIAVTHTGDATNGGWNGVANNGLTDNQLSGDFTYIQTLNSEDNCFEAAEASEKPLAIGNAAMVQVSASGSVVVGETSSAVAARRMGEAASTEFINVRLYKENQNQHVDQIFIRASEDASEQYVAGIDLSKATMGTPKVARMWVNDYDLQLVANEALMTNDQATFSLGMSAPANGEYTIAIDNTPNDAIVYLTMNGSAIWNLNIAPAPLSLSKGTENSYGLRLVRKINNVVTGLDEAVLNGNVQKVILNDHLYIIRDGKVYSAHGHVIK